VVDFGAGDGAGGCGGGVLLLIALAGGRIAPSLGGSGGGTDGGTTCMATDGVAESDLADAATASSSPSSLISSYLLDMRPKVQL
jgi:hypothetical protein